MTSARPDPRVRRTRAHVLDHARELLADRGAAAVTYTELADRAAVTRQTLYRHWPTIADLLVDVVLDRALPEVPDSNGTPAEVLGLFLRRLRDGMDEPAQAAAVTGLIAAADHDPTCGTALERTVIPFVSALDALLRPAGLRIDVEQYARLCGPVLYQRLVARTPVTDGFVDRLVADWLATRDTGQPTTS